MASFLLCFLLILHVHVTISCKSSAVQNAPVETTQNREKLIVATGYADNRSRSTEAFDLTNSKTCPSLPDYPLDVSGASGAFVNNKLIICGGALPLSDKCYSIGPQEAAWQEAGTLLTPRRRAAAIELDGKLFTMGGFQSYYDSDTLNSTEIMDLESKVSTYGPNLPTKLHSFCIVKVNASNFLIIGGYDGSESVNSTFWFSTRDQTFRPGPELTVARSEHACGILTTADKRRFVVVAGGYSKGDYFDLTEVLELDQPTAWKEGPRLPKALSLFGIVEHNNKVVAVGGFYQGDSNSIMYSLDCVSQDCSWEELPMKLQFPRNEHLSIVVPDNFVSCS